MKISFIAVKDNPINIFKELAEELSKKVSGLELTQRFVPELDDLPIVALEETEESDFIFVFAITDDENEKLFLDEKLVDVELKTKTRILKAIEQDEFSDLGEEEYNAEKDNLVEKYIKVILGILFNEEEFEPEDKDFSI